MNSLRTDGVLARREHARGQHPSRVHGVERVCVHRRLEEDGSGLLGGPREGVR